MSVGDFTVLDPNIIGGTDLTNAVNLNNDALLTSHENNIRPNYVKRGTIWLDNSTGEMDVRLLINNGAQDMLIATLDIVNNTITLNAPGGGGGPGGPVINPGDFRKIQRVNDAETAWQVADNIQVDNNGALSVLNNLAVGMTVVNTGWTVEVLGDTRFNGNVDVFGGGLSLTLASGGPDARSNAPPGTIHAEDEAWIDGDITCGGVVWVQFDVNIQGNFITTSSVDAFNFINTSLTPDITFNDNVDVKGYGQFNNYVDATNNLTVNSVDANSNGAQLILYNLGQQAFSISSNSSAGAGSAKTEIIQSGSGDMFFRIGGGGQIQFDNMNVSFFELDQGPEDQVTFGARVFNAGLGGQTAVMINNKGQIKHEVNDLASYFIQEYYNSTSGIQVGSIIVSPSITSFTTTSDYRLKENITPLRGALNKVMQLRPVIGNFKNDSQKMEMLIAHEVQAVAPYAVVGEKDALTKEGKVQPQMYDASKLIPLLVGAIQDLRHEVTQLKSGRA